MPLLINDCLSQTETNYFIDNCCCDFICVLTNDSSLPFVITQIVFNYSYTPSGFNESDITIDGNPFTGNYTIGPNDSVNFGFTLCANQGAPLMTIRIRDGAGNYTDFNFQLQSIPLSTYLPSSVDCGTVAVGFSTTTNLLIPRTIACCVDYLFFGLVSPFSIQSSQTVCNGPGDVNVEITFTPNITGSFGQTLTISVLECGSHQLSVTGVATESTGLFISYIDPNNEGQIFCDNTSFEPCTDPISRLFCSSLQIYCPGNTFCGTLAVNNGLVLCDCNDSWNCNLCGNDAPFWLPFIDGDLYMFQFQQSVNESATNGWYNGNNSGAVASFDILPCCGTEIRIDWLDYFDQIVFQSFVGKYGITTHDQQQIEIPIQQIQFDLNAIAQILIANGIDPCFSIQFDFATSGTFPDPAEKQTYCSEPFKLISCNEPTVLIESEFTKTDCFNFYYGENWIDEIGTPFPYENKIRIPASFEQTNFQISKNVIESTRRAVSSELCETWTLNSYALPPRMAKIVANIMTGANIKVNNQPFTFTGDIPKNNDISTRWYISANFENCDCNHQLTSCE